MRLWQKVILGLITGVVLGLILKERVYYIKPIGDVFIKMIKMVIIPLVFFAIVGGITSVSDSRSLGRVGLKASLAYILTTTFAILIGLGTAILLEPGKGLDLRFEANTMGQVPEGTPLQKLYATLMGIVPDNAIAAMAEGVVLQVVFFAVFTGITIHHLPLKERDRIQGIFQLLASMVFKMVHLIVRLSPYAAASLTAYVVGTQGIAVLKNLGTLIVGMILACTLQYLLFGVMIWFFSRLSPWPFYRKSLEYQALAFATSSSKAALATTIDVARNKMGVSEPSSSFVLPLGASINMDGMAIYLGLCAVFFAQAVGKTLGLTDYALIILTATLGSIGGAGIPSGSIVMLPMVLEVVGLPVSGIGLILGVDRILDMIRTTINITGDVAVTLIVDNSEGTLNRERYMQDVIPEDESEPSIHSS